MTFIQFVVRRQLQTEGIKLAGLYPENPQKQTDKPTVERLLRAFVSLTLTIVQLNGERLVHPLPLSTLQMQIIQALGLPPDIYSKLAGNSE